MLTWQDSIKPFIPEVKDRSKDSSSEDCVVADSLDVIFYFFLQNIRKYENDKVKAKQKEKHTLIKKCQNLVNRSETENTKYFNCVRDSGFAE